MAAMLSPAKFHCQLVFDERFTQQDLCVCGWLSSLETSAEERLSSAPRRASVFSSRCSVFNSTGVRLLGAHAAAMVCTPRMSLVEAQNGTLPALLARVPSAISNTTLLDHCCSRSDVCACCDRRV